MTPGTSLIEQDSPRETIKKGPAAFLRDKTFEPVRKELTEVLGCSDKGKQRARNSKKLAWPLFM